jgi:cytochrome P450
MNVTVAGDRKVPTVRGNPLLGSLLEIRSGRVDFLLRVAREHGDVARARLGVFRVVIVSAADLAHEMLVEKTDAFVKGYGLSVFARPLLGNGLLTSEKQFHTRQRRLVAPAFAHKRVAAFADVMAAAADQCVARLREGETVDLAAEMMRLTLVIVGKTLFDADVAGDAPEVGEVLTFAMEHMTKSLMSFLPVPPFVPTPANRRALAQVARLDEIIYRIVRERRASKHDAGDLLSMLLMAQDEDGSVMTDRQVRDEAMTLFLAGHETTANALSWAFYLLGKHPEARARLEAEVVGVLGGRRPTFADLPRLPYALAVFKEAMRLYPPAYVIARRALREVSLGGVPVKKNQIVMLNIIGMHRRAKYFDHPEAFRPERFLPENEKLLQKGAYIPFGGGPRVCIGNQFALMEGQILLAHLAQSFRFELVDRHVEPQPLVTLRPRGGMRVRPTRVRPYSDVATA